MKKNKVFVNKIEKRINNNQTSFDINNSVKKDIKKDNNVTIREKIDKLLDRNGYIFNVSVKIITNQKEYHTYIAGVVNNHIVTLDKDIIDISNIKDIIIEE